MVGRTLSPSIRGSEREGLHWAFRALQELLQGLTRSDSVRASRGGRGGDGLTFPGKASKVGFRSVKRSADLPF